MDILFLSYPKINPKYLNIFDNLVRGISEDHHIKNFDESRTFQAWQSDSGESCFHFTNQFDIWFDGYFSSTGNLLLPDFLETLAIRIVQKGEVLKGDESGIFNIIIKDRQTKKIYLANDPGGLFPLYFTLQNKTLFVSTHFYLMAKTLEAKPNYAQVVSKEVFGYAIGPDTYFEGVKRLLPGELIIFDPRTSRLASKNSELYFQGYQEHHSHIIEKVYNSLKTPVSWIVEDNPKVGVMLSEGFDSRLIAALFKQAGAEVHSFTHGTYCTKGARVAEKTAAKLGVNHHFEEVVFPADHDQIQRQLLLSDNLHIPFWHRGSRYFGGLGLDAVVAGTALDSTLGGHIFYRSSRKRLQAIYQRYQEILRQNLGWISNEYIENLSEELIKSFLNIDTKRLERRLKERFIPDIAKILISNIDPFRDCLQTEFERIFRTGSDKPSLKLQRFFLEHRARRFSFGQELTLRMDNHVVVPTYEKAFLAEVTQIPIQYKLHHGIYLKFLKHYFPKAASLPSGNYTLPANYPRLLLESSRFLGKVQDLKIINNYLKSKGRTNYCGFRGALFQDHTARDERLFCFLFSFLKSNTMVLNERFYTEYLKRVETYQARTFQFNDFYRAIEFCQIFQHSF